MATKTPAKRKTAVKKKRTQRLNNTGDPVMYGISRIDSVRFRSHAWRVSLRRQRRVHVRNFSDKSYGGKAKALAAAKQYRDRFLKRYSPLSRQEFSNAKRRNNRSGITGVYKSVMRYRLANGRWREIYYWAAHWPTTVGKFICQRFRVDRLGEREAFRRACEARTQGLARVKGVYWVSDR